RPVGRRTRQGAGDQPAAGRGRQGGYGGQGCVHRRPRRSYPAAQGSEVRRRPVVPIKGVLFDKDGTLVDFHATWSAVADRMALEAAEGDRPAADRLLAAAGYDVDTGHFKADSVFAAGTNRDIVDLWFPDLPRRRQD